tara:strand:+ start:230 stop:4582 length:4353 start_codon:yes stop_codon:yes gene_type:complete
MSVESRRKQREPKTETEKAFQAEKAKEGLKAMAIGPVTGLLGLPSDIIDLADMANDAIAKYGKDTTIAQFSKLIKPQLDKLQEKYGREQFDKGFTELTGIKSDISRPSQILGELVSLGSLAKAGVKGAKILGESLSDAYKGTEKLFETQTDLLTKGPTGGSGGAAVETAGVGQLDQTKKLLKDEQKAITTEAPTTIPPDEFINAPKVDKMSMGGKNTPTGAEQIKKYKELDKTKKYNPDELFEMTGVYKGEDGKFRWEIDTTDAELKNVQTITDAKNGDAFFLSNLLKFDKLYQEYFKPIKVTRPSQVFKGQKSFYEYKPIKNLGVILKKKDKEGTLGDYSPATDKITLYTDNILTKAIDDQANFILSTGKTISLDTLYKFRLESTLLHEVQHAIQGREGFTRGSNTQNFLRDGYSQDLKTNDALLNNSYNNLIDNFEAEGALPTIRDRDLLNKNVDRIKRAFDEKSLPLIDTSSLVDQVTNDLRRIPMPTTSMTKNVIKSYVQKVKQYHINKKALDDEYDVAYNKYRDDYGEREARLVQDRFERRLDLKAQREEAIKQGKTPSGDFLSIEKQMSAYEPIPKDMKGVTSAERDRLSKIARTDPVTGKVKPRIAIGKNTDEVLEVSKSIERTPVKENPALKKIGEITKLRDGTLGSRTPMDKDGLPKNLVRDKDGKPLVLYYGDSGLVYDETTKSFKPSKIPGKLKNKFEPSGRTYEEGKYIGNFATPNPAFASGYAGRRGSVIPIYIIADKVTNIKARSFLDIDKASGKAKRGEVVVGDVGFDAPSTNLSPEARKASVKKYGTEQYAFNRGTQVFSAITGERLTNLPSIKQNIKNRLLNLSKKEEDILLKNLSSEDRLKYKNIKTGGDGTDDFDEKFIDDLFYMFRDMDLKKNLEKREVAKGGDIMKKQMELFDEGGLKDEGNTVDPVSGNDVPPGATQEEVRDDIPAQLSEGEFVFPADVVRYLGLEFLMKLRQKAKAGLKRMEDMGQMGNADEATIPDDAPFNPSQDDLPFTMEDLDMEDEKEYNEGGVVKAQTGTFVAPGAGTNVMQPQNSYPTPIGPRRTLYTPPKTTPEAAPVGGFMPRFTAQTGQGGQQTSAPTFQTLLGATPGQYDEFRKYVNEAGMVLNIPFKNGEPIYPIPEGYTFVDPEATKTEEVTTKEVTPQTTRVVEDTSSGDDDEEPKGAVDLTGAALSYKSIFNMDKLDTELKDIASNQFNLFNLYGAVDRGVTGTIDLNNAILEAQKVTMTNFKNDVRGTTNFNLVDLTDNERDNLAGKLSGISKTYEDLFTDTDGKSLSINELIDKVNEISGKVGGRKLSMDDFTIVTKTGQKTNIISKRKVNNMLNSLVMDTTFKEERQKQKNVEQVKKNEEANFFKDIPTTYTDPATGKQIDDPLSDSGYEEGDYTGGEGTDVGGGETSFVGDDPAFKQGGLASKKKPKVKKMKRGGLASR